MLPHRCRVGSAAFKHSHVLVQVWDRERILAEPSANSALPSDRAVTPRVGIPRAITPKVGTHRVVIPRVLQG